MKSNVCKIENSTRDLDAILKESQKVADYNNFTHKQAMHLRLLCEELAGMLPYIIDNFDGKFWVEYDEGVCKVNVSVKIPEFNAEKKEELIGISKSKKNSAAVGIVGKIRNTIEDFFLNDDAMSVFDASSGTFSMATGYTEGVDYSYLWSLDQYRDYVEKENKTENWDELEKSVIASIADDVIVGVKGKKADIIIVKKFA